MSCYTDYKKVLNNNYFNSTSLENLKTNKISSEINTLVKKLQKLSNEHSDVIETALDVLSDLSFYKMALETKVTANKIPDVNVPKRIYIQLRGAVPYDKGKRVWISQYVGKMEEVCDDGGNILHSNYCQGREAVVLKLVERLKEAE
jgi:hypothetical protein